VAEWTFDEGKPPPARCCGFTAIALRQAMPLTASDGDSHQGRSSGMHGERAGGVGRHVFE